ncbi:MAG: LEA type 2 family protein [Longimicrobiales bacterium]|nr:LEA type 2 family protein [Longimicrobiales bacterium]
MMPTFRPGRLAPLLALLPALTACASLVKEPQVSLVQVELASIGLTGATARVQLDIHNPNRFALDARAVEYTLAFHPDDPSRTPEVPDDAWRPLATGRTAEAVSLAGQATTPVTVLVPFTYREVGDAVASLLRDGRLRYRFFGSFTVDSAVGDFRIPFDRNGILDP